MRRGKPSRLRASAFSAPSLEGESPLEPWIVLRRGRLDRVSPSRGLVQVFFSDTRPGGMIKGPAGTAARFSR